MPFSRIADFEKSFPGIKKLTPHQKEIALEVFNNAKKRGFEDGRAIAQAISAARRFKGSDELRTRVLSLASLDVNETDLENMEFQVLKVGEFYDQRYGVFKITEEKLQNLKQNFDQNVLGVELALDVNHEPEKGALAWVKSLEVKGGVLWAKFKDFTEEGKKYFLDKVYRYFSVEFGPFERVEGGKKMTIKDVLRGIALTNRPVIKGMQPTFLAEDMKEPNSPSKKAMSVQAIKLFAENLLSREKVSKEDKLALRSMLTILSDDEKVEVEELVEKVEAKVEEAPAEASKEEPKEEPKEPEAAAAAELSEANKKLAEQAKEIEALKAAEKKRVTDDRVKSLTLSETTRTGFSAELSEKVNEFIVGLSDEQFDKFSDLVKSVTSVSDAMLAEMGSHMMPEHKKDMDSKLAEAAKLAEKYEKEGMAKHLAVEKAQKEVMAVK
jgi:hypothetical protein